MLHANILCLDRVKNCIKEVEEMFPWIVVLAVLGLVMIFAEILMPGFGLFGILGTISLFGSLALTFKIYGLYFLQWYFWQSKVDCTIRLY